jgi:ferric-dicitrate binding protein FerR (iron transport regulator)
MRPEDLEDLISRYLGGALSEEEEKHLLDLLVRSPEACNALGRELVVDRLIRESRKPSLAADRILQALPRGSGEEFARGVMERLPRRRTSFVPGLAAAGLLAALVLYAALRTPAPPPLRPDGPTARSSESEAPGRPEAMQERDRAEAERKRMEASVASLRKQEAEAARERERVERDPQEEARKKADEEVLRLKTEREAEEAKFVEALERARRAAAEVARPSEGAPRPAPLPAKTETIAATIPRVEGRVTLLDGPGNGAVSAPQSLLPGQGLETSSKDGAAILTFADRTQLELGPGTEIRSVFDQEPPGKGARGKRLVVVRGRVTATVAKQPPEQPFVLATPHAEAKVVGTTLRLTVDASATRLEVTEGKVRLSRADGKSVDVPGGQLAVAAPGLELSTRTILDRLHYEAALLKRPDLLFFEDFEQDGWKRHWSSPSEAAVVTEDRAASLVGRRALDVRMKGGDWNRLTMAAGSPRLHVRAYFFFPKDFEFGPQGGLSLFKVGALPAGPGVQEGFSLWADHRPNGRDFFSADLLLTSRWNFQFGYYHPDQSGPKGDWKDGEVAGAISLKPGRWHSVELLCQANDPGQKNGLLRAWIDGTLCNEEKGIRFRDGDALLLREFALAGGGAPGPKAQSYCVDDVVVARDYIGAAFGDADGVEPRPKR